MIVTNHSNKLWRNKASQSICILAGNEDPRHKGGCHGLQRGEKKDREGQGWGLLSGWGEA